ncbi:ChaN family lipoprotein [Spirosoma luteolum]
MRTTLLLLAGLLAFSFRPDKPAYRLYDARVKAVDYAQLLRQAAQADVVLFGELHNNPICHWLELQLAKDLARLKKGQLVLGAEMFETDNQPALSRYVTGTITDKEFAAQARLWPNYDTDYKPLTELARTQHLPFVATNIPRRYASLVARQGLVALDTVSAASRALMMPLPLTVDLTRPGYKAMLDMMGGSAHGSGSASPHGSTGDMAANFARAQAVKDATMAYFIRQNLKPGQTLLHINGDYHSKNFDGIVAYLRENPDRPLRILTIASLEVPNPDEPTKGGETTDLRHLADFVLAIPSDMTKTY